MGTLTDIFQKLWAKGLLRPRNGWISKHSSSNFDLSKNCAYNSNIQGHDTKECATLRNKIQTMIEKGKIIVQQGPQNNNCNYIETFIVQGDPTKVYVKHLTRKHNSHQRSWRVHDSYEQTGFIILRPYARSFSHSFHFTFNLKLRQTWFSFKRDR